VSSALFRTAKKQPKNSQARAMTEHASQPRAPLVLASGSRFRLKLLTDAGLTLDVDPAHIDEASLKQSLLASSSRPTPDALALALATAKARDVAARHPGRMVLGSDQVLALPGAPAEIFSKARDMADAAHHIARLAGRTHHLHTAAVLMRDTEPVWHIVRTAALTMRSLSPRDIDRYIARAGLGICDTVGAYMLEGLGAQLFDKIDGDTFTIIGLPLLDVLAALRALGEETL
jgi:septum formation protein